MGIKHGLWAGLIAGTATFGFSLLLLQPESPETPRPEGSVTTVKATGSAPAADANREPIQPESTELPLGDTVEGIAIDGAIRVDINGNLVFDRDLRRFMDFFIGLTQSAEDEALMRKRMRQSMMDKDIPEAIRKDVMEALDRYLGYRNAAANLEARRGGSSPERMRSVLKELKQLRRSHLGEAMAKGFFGREQQRLENQLARQRIQSNPDLSTAEKRNRLKKLQNQLPEHVQRVRDRSRTYTNLRQQTRRMREDGASDATIHALRTRELGAKAADQLAKLDDRRGQWERQLKRYQQRKKRLLNNNNLTNADRQQALEKLRTELFDSDAERRRAKALTRIDASRQDG